MFCAARRHMDNQGLALELTCTIWAHTCRWSWEGRWDFGMRLSWGCLSLSDKGRNLKQNESREMKKWYSISRASGRSPETHSQPSDKWEKVHFQCPWISTDVLSLRWFPGKRAGRSLCRCRTASSYSTHPLITTGQGPKVSTVLIIRATNLGPKSVLS